MIHIILWSERRTVVLGRPECHQKLSSKFTLSWVMWRGCFASAYTFRPGSKQRTDSMPSVQSLHCTVFDSSGWSSSFQVSLALICPPVSPPSPPTVTLQPECSPFWRFSPQGYVRCFGLSSSRSMSWAQPTSSWITTTPFNLTCLRCRGNWRHLRDPDYLRALADDHARSCVLFFAAPGAQ